MLRQIALSLLAVGFAKAAAVHSGHAAAEWIAESAEVAPGSVVRTAIRLEIAPRWHTYWINPGEAGMAPSIDWEMPDGFRLVSFTHPWPKRFHTGDLVGFGHDGTVWFPAEIAVPEDFSGEVELGVTLRWLTCNNHACVPGKARLCLKLCAGDSVLASETGPVAKAFEAAPVAAGQGVSLLVARRDGMYEFRIAGPGAFEPQSTLVETPDIVDPRAAWRWKSDGQGWMAVMPQSPYATGDPDRIRLWVRPGKAARALVLSWKKSP